MGHQENDQWVDLWQFVLLPQSGGSTRLILRTRTMMVGGMWDIIHPGVFIMERGMLLGIKERAEKLAQEKLFHQQFLREIYLFRIAARLAGRSIGVTGVLFYRPGS